jgi:hypothetical protein
MTAFPGATIDLLRPTPAPKVQRFLVVPLVCLASAIGGVLFLTGQRTDRTQQLEDLNRQAVGNTSGQLGDNETSRRNEAIERELQRARRDLGVPWNRRLLLVDELASHGLVPVRWAATAQASEQQAEVAASGTGKLLAAVAEANRGRTAPVVTIASMSEDAVNPALSARARVVLFAEESGDARNQRAR